LLRIDPRSYQQQVAQEQGALENAALQVDVEKNHRELAQYESELLGQVGQRSRVATREGHVQAAEAGVMARQSAVASAQLNLQRTVIRAPFDASVVEDNVAVGQVVHSQTQVAHLVATAVLRVEVSLPLEDITMFEFPSESSPGALARVRQALPRGQQVEREGRVARLVQQLDSSTRRARVLVTVEDPFDPSRGLPLLPGAHVEVTIQGKQLQNLVAIERAAVYDGNTIWIVDEASKLRRRSITTLWSDRTHVYARPDFGAKERVVTTLLATPMEGLPVRTLQTPAPELEHQAKASKENSGG
jgi:RND family efflux transporter MFP subunit